MKKIYLFLILACVPFLANAQAEAGCFVQVQTQNVLCFGDCNGSAMAFPGGPAPYIYTWLPGGQTTQSITNLCAGSYTVNVIDANNCTATATFNIIEPYPITIGTTVTNESCNGCCDGYVTSTVTGGTPAYTYLWSPTGQTSPVLQAACSGTYTLCVTDMNGCTNCDIATVSFSTGIIEQSGNGNLLVFPNPASGSLTIQETFSRPLSVEIRLLNVLGETLLLRSEQAVTNVNTTLNISYLPSGVYFIAVSTDSGTVVQKIVKE